MRALPRVSKRAYSASQISFFFLFALRSSSLRCRRVNNPRQLTRDANYPTLFRFMLVHPQQRRDVATSTFPSARSRLTDRVTIVWAVTTKPFYYLLLQLLSIYEKFLVDARRFYALVRYVRMLQWKLRVSRIFLQLIHDGVRTSLVLIQKYQSRSHTVASELDVQRDAKIRRGKKQVHLFSMKLDIRFLPA